MSKRLRLRDKQSAARLGRTRRVVATYLLLAGLQRGVSFLVLPFISHAMSPSQYGAASLLAAVAILLTAMLAAPLDQLVFRASARGENDGPALIRVVGAYCYVIFPFLMAIVALSFVLFVPELFGVRGAVWGIEILAVGYQPAATTYALPLVRARQDLIKFACIALISISISLVSKIVFVVSWRLDVLGWVISDLLSAALTAIVAMALVRTPPARITLGHVRSVLRFAIPLIPHRASFWALSSLSRPATAAVSSMAQVGLLSFGLNLAAIATLILAEINQAVLPYYSRETFPAPTVETKSAARWQFVLAVTVPALVGAGIGLGGPALFAADYWMSFGIVGILLCGQAAYGLYLIPMNYLVQSAGLPKFSSLASASGAVVILVGILVVGRNYGALGVAYVTVAGFVVMATVAFILIRALKLAIFWHSWRSCRIEVCVGAIGLACCVIGLSLPAGSAPSYWLCAVCLSLTAAAYAIAYRRGSS